METSNHKLAMLDRIDLLKKNLNELDRQGLANLVTVRRYQKGEIIYSSQERNGLIYFLVEGRVKLYRLSERGRQITLGLHYEGEVFGEMALAAHEVAEEFAETLAPSYVLIVPTPAFIDFMTAHPGLCLAMTRLMANRLLQSQQQMENLTSKDVVGRLACLIFDMAKHQFGEVINGVRLRHNLTHEEMGNLVGASRETVTSALSRLADAGAVIYYPHSRATLIVRDVQNLKACANGQLAQLLPEGNLNGPKSRRERERASLQASNTLALVG